jgi:hypothetical protein
LPHRVGGINFLPKVEDFRLFKTRNSCRYEH